MFDLRRSNFRARFCFLKPSNQRDPEHSCGFWLYQYTCTLALFMRIAVHEKYMPVLHCHNSGCICTYGQPLPRFVVSRGVGPISPFIFRFVTVGVLQNALCVEVLSEDRVLTSSMPMISSCWATIHGNSACIPTSSRLSGAGACAHHFWWSVGGSQ